MKNICLVLTLCLIGFTLSAQLNFELKHQLDSIQQLDQYYREEASKVISNEMYSDSILQISGMTASDYVRDLMMKQETVDLSNLYFIDSILSIYGYPGRSLVGSPTDQTAWYIIQHSEKLENYYKTIVKATKKGEIPDSLFAKTKDRLLIHSQRKQLYGTQANCTPNDSGNFDCFILPIRNFKRVNERRKNMGFTTTIEEYATKYGYVIKK
jgi:hypothetical protein